MSHKSSASKVSIICYWIEYKTAIKNSDVCTYKQNTNKVTADQSTKITNCGRGVLCVSAYYSTQQLEKTAYG